MSEAVGPIFAAGFQHIVNEEYGILYLPDLHNDELQREGKAPVYWWLPNEVRLARKGGDKGDYKFSFIHFQGRRAGSTNIGVDGTAEVTGGLLGFSTTTAPPLAILAKSQEQLTQRLTSAELRGDRFWGRRNNVAPNFRPAPIVSNTTTITNLSPMANNTVPAVAPASGGDGGAEPDAGGDLPPGAREFGGPPLVRAVGSPILMPSPRSVPLRSAMRGSNLDQWYVNLQGQGSGSVNPFAENAYSGLVGSMPAALIWASFHGGTGGIAVWQNMRIKVWSPVVHISVRGSWRRVQEHFSAAAKFGNFFWSADVQAEFNNLRVNGDIKVTVEVDTTLPNADKIQEEMNKRSDLVFQKFMEQAQKLIFDAAPFEAKPAEASGHGGFLGFGGGAAFKLRRDTVNVTLDYDETRQFAYLQEYPVSSQLEGLHDVIGDNPAAEKKYFQTLYLDDWERKVARVVKPVMNAAEPAQKWSGDPVAFLSVQVGYPNTKGAVQWDGHIFQPTDGPNAHWETATSMKKVTDVQRPPAGWTPDKTFVKRKIHFAEPPSELANPFVRMSVEKNEVDLDPGEYGRLVSDINLEVRVDSVGLLEVGPIGLGVDLDSPKQIVEVTFQAEGNRDDGKPRPPVKFRWTMEDQAEPRYWKIFTGQPGFVPRYKYQVRVIVKGSLFTKGMEWTGPWVQASANGPMMVTVPTPEDEGVVTRSIVPSLTAAQPVPALPPSSISEPSVPPPSSGVTVPPPSRRDVPVSADGPTEFMGWLGLGTTSDATAPPPKRGAPDAPPPAGGDGGDGDMFTGFSAE
jgi:hypothetical protein